MEVMKDVSSKLRSSSKIKKESALEKDPVKELRRATLKRSSSLDSTTFRAISQEVSEWYQNLEIRFCMHGKTSWSATLPPCHFSSIHKRV